MNYCRNFQDKQTFLRHPAVPNNRHPNYRSRTVNVHAAVFNLKDILPDSPDSTEVILKDLRMAREKQKMFES